MVGVLELFKGWVDVRWRKSHFSRNLRGSLPPEEKREVGHVLWGALSVALQADDRLVIGHLLHFRPYAEVVQVVAFFQNHRQLIVEESDSSVLPAVYHLHAYVSDLSCRRLKVRSFNLGIRRHGRCCVEHRGCLSIAEVKLEARQEWLLYTCVADPREAEVVSYRSHSLERRRSRPLLVSRREGESFDTVVSADGAGSLQLRILVGTCSSFTAFGWVHCMTC